MRGLLVLLGVLGLSGCGQMFSDLESQFAGQSRASGKQVLAETIVITSQRHAGAEQYRQLARVYVSKAGVDIELSLPFTKPVSIPTGEIAGCSMTCFGFNDQHVDLLIPRVGADVQIPASQELLNWCWENKRPMYSGNAKRQWVYKNSALPAPTEFTAQFQSRAIFDAQVKQSCLGY